MRPAHAYYLPMLHDGSDVVVDAARLSMGGLSVDKMSKGTV
jgi:hypothetical protein